MSDVTLNLGYLPSDDWNFKDDLKKTPLKQGTKDFHHIFNIIGYVPGLAIVTGIFRVVIGIHELCKSDFEKNQGPGKKIEYSKLFIAFFIVRGTVEALGGGIVIGILGDLPITIYRFATKTKKESIPLPR
jgi:hypothetical protein